MLTHVTQLRRVVTVGGGPAGLLAAILMKENDPATEVEVLERNPADAGYGFGLVFSAVTLANLRADVPWLHDDLTRLGRHWSDIELRLHGENLRLGGNSFTAVSRSRLVGSLRQHAETTGVRLTDQREVTDPEDIDADLVLGADGVSSRIRDHFAGRFFPEIRVATAKYAWFGGYADFDALTFLFERTEHGWFAVHGYPYDEEGTCTFLVETDPATWERARPTGYGPDETPAPGASDEVARRFCSEVFAGSLLQPGLLANNSVWRNFVTLRTKTWHHDRYVLLGDAAHTAHFSVGSGTKMALEDAIALATALRATNDLPAALREYEARRKPKVERLQAAAEPSMAWWENFRRYVDLPMPQLGMHFLSRSGRVTHQRASEEDPEFVRGLDRWFSGGEGVDAVLGTPFDGPSWRLTSRVVALSAGSPVQRGVRSIVLRDGRMVVDPQDTAGELPGVLLDGLRDGQDVEQGVADAVAAAERGAQLVMLRADPATAEAGTLARSQISERLRLEHGLPTVTLEDPPDFDLAAQLVLSGRTDLVAVPAEAIGEHPGISAAETRTIEHSPR
jgi:2-polyprenyl-6-methoxyphenol hydroxylase-like FAD-dependent oxidoreductase